MKLQTNVTILLGSLCTFSSAMVMGLGFGEIKLNSTLNQPLEAEIELINIKDLTEREIVVGMASNAEFDRAGVDKVYFLAEFEFEVDLDAQGGPVVRVKTEDPVKEPYLNFIVYGQWPSGKLLREYTVLVDLPVFSGAKTGPVRVAGQTAPEPGASVSFDQEEPSSISVPVGDSRQSSTEQLEAESQYQSDVYGPVSANDTLWAIAADVRPSSSYSVQQTMLAIQRLNPNAFINNNINLLKRGQVLRVPTGEEISQLSLKEAVREVAGQNDTWSSKQSESYDDGAQLEGSKNFAETKTDATDVEGRVKLSSNALSSSEEVNQGTIEGQEGSALVEALDVTQEELDAETRERGELASKLDALDEQIATMEKLVEVSNAELLALEQAAQVANNPKVETLIDEPELVEDIVDQPISVDEPTEAVAVEPAPPAVQPAPQPKSIMDILMENIVYVAGGLGALVLVIAGFLFLRNRNDGFDDDYDDELDEFSSFEGNGFDEDQNELDSEEEPTLIAGEDSTEIINDDQDAEEELSSEAETEDVVGECDIHLAYGQYDQAEEKLAKALDTDPGNAQIRLKLLEALSAQGDADAFDANYAKLLVLNDPEVTEKANSLREGVIDIGPFDSAKYDTRDFCELVGIAAPNSTEASDEALDLSNDTLNFDAADEHQEIEADIEGEDKTMVAPSANAEVRSEELDEAVSENVVEDTDELSALLDSEDDTEVLLDDSELSLESDDEEAELDLDDFDLNDLDLDLGEDGIEGGDSSDNLSDIEFNFSGNDIVEEDVNDEVDDRPVKESLSSEFSENLVADSSSSLANLEGLDFEQDEDDIDLSALEDDSELSEGLDLNALDDLDLEQEVADLGELELDAELPELETDLGESPEELVENELTLEEGSTEEQSEGDFDVSFNLDNGLDLDELDQELDQLAAPELNLEEDQSDLEAQMEETSEELDNAIMEEPETDLESIATHEPVADVQLESSVEAANEPEVEVAEQGLELSPTAEFDAAFEIPDFDPESDDDSNLDFLSDNDETATKLDLARAYIDMGDADGAKDILDEILEEGDDGQKKDAEGLLKKLA